MDTTIKIKSPNIKTGELWIKGTSPLVVNKFSHKAILAMENANKVKKPGHKASSEKATPEETFQAARHISLEGWDGFPATAIRNGCISACRLVNFKMTLAKLSIFVKEDGWDATEASPLIRIIGHEPEMLRQVARSNNAGKIAAVLTYRPMWKEWGACLHIKYDEDQFSASDIVNLIARVGAQVGICEGRPDSRSSCGMGWGTFEISTKEEVLKLEKKKAKK